MKKRCIKVMALMLTLCLVAASFCACSKDKNETKKAPDTKTEEKAPEKEVPKSEAETAKENTDTETKYGKTEVYQKDGESYAKTDDGQEVELSGESLQDLMAAYEKVKGTGSAEEKDILNKIQLILEAPKN